MQNVLVVGAGSIGERHIRCFLRTRRATVSVCECNDEIPARIESDYSIERSDPALEDALAVPHSVVPTCHIGKFQ